MKYWAKLILFFSVVILLAIAVIVRAEEDYREFSNKPPAADDLRVLESTVDTFQKPEQDATYYNQFKKNEEDLQKIYDLYYGQKENTKQEAKNNTADCEHPLQVDYYFSFSLPESSIKSAVEDALTLRKKCVRVKMYLRGLKDNNLKKTIVSFYSIARANPEDLPIEIDPVKFQSEKIQAVPTTIINGKRLVGDMKLSGVIYNLDVLQEGKIAVSYPIREDDLIELFKKRAHLAERKMKKYLESGKIYDRFKLTRYDGKYAEAKKKKIYYIDPTQTLAEDIRDNNGTILFPRGTQVNPLDQITIGKYIFIDGHNADQIMYAVRGKYRKIILVSGDTYELSKKHKKEFYHMTDELAGLFRVERVPLIIEQEGRLIRATEQPI